MLTAMATKTVRTDVKRAASARKVKPVAKKKPATAKPETRAKPTARAGAIESSSPTPSVVGKALAARTAAERERRFNILLRNACLKAGSAAAITLISTRVPLLGRIAPALMGSVTEAMALARIHQQLVRDILDLYDLDLSELEERGVILLSTAANLGAQQLSKQMVEQIVKQFGGKYLRPLASRLLPLAGIVTEIAASIAATYAVGKRAQVLCNLPGSGARNLSDLLRGLTGIDQRRLLSWSTEALKLALSPFRAVLTRRSKD
jgi:hypothetical protein